jgi:hypothetical protein
MQSILAVLLLVLAASPVDAGICFGNQTTVSVLNGQGIIIDVPIALVQPQDKILTLMQGKVSEVRVTQNDKYEGEFDFFEFEAVSRDNSSRVLTVSVTPTHVMILVKTDTLIFSLPNDIRVGDLFHSHEGVFEVSKIRKYSSSEKYTLVTNEGTLLASGILVSTICEEEIVSGGEVTELLTIWKQKHHYTT